MRAFLLPVSERELLQPCFFLCADFLLGQTDVVGFGGWKSRARMPLGKQTEPSRVVVGSSEGADGRGRVLSRCWRLLCSSRDGSSALG